jgi:hypothetical protein
MPSRRHRLRILTRNGQHTDCSYCGHPTNIRFGLTLIHDWNLATIDHVLPRAYGRDESRQNTRLACMWCNVGRSMSGHCIAAFRCAEAIVGRGDMAAITRWHRENGVPTGLHDCSGPRHGRLPNSSVRPTIFQGVTVTDA